MAVDSLIFKAYDVRGTYPDQINGDVAYQIGFALADYLKPKSIAIGRDMRVSSDELFDYLVRGINDNGVDVIDLGLISTDGLYFAVGKYGYEGGVMITASHNPKQYNGFKICREHAEPVSGSEGLDQILKAIQENPSPRPKPERGMTVRRNIDDEYARHCLSFIDISKVKEYHVVIDAGNGIAGKTLPPVLSELKKSAILSYSTVMATNSIWPAGMLMYNKPY